MTRFLSAGVPRGMGLVIAVLLIAPVVFAGELLTLGAEVNVSGTSTPFSPGCEVAPQTGTNFPNGEVEPSVDISAANANNIVAGWQQDRWSNGGSHGLLTGVSHDGGATWTTKMVPFSICAGGTYERASDPWVSFSSGGSIAYQVAIAFNNSNPNSSVQVSTSTNAGDTWGAPIVLRADTAATVLNDKESVTADPNIPLNAYVIWDRLVFPQARAKGKSFEHAIGYRGPTWFSMTTDGGTTWSTARIIFDPGEINQTIGNVIVVRPQGTLVDGMNLIFNRKNTGHDRGFNVAVIRSTDTGTTWSEPIIVSKLLSIPVTDPNTGEPVRTGDILPSWAVDHSNGNIYVVWQDARFSGFTHDDILFSMSTDGGLTWSAPAKINQTPVATHAFTATVSVAPGGRIAVTYYDFRELAAGNTTTLPTDYSIINCQPSSADCTLAVNWSPETCLAGSAAGCLAPAFDMKLAPVTDSGFFVGDYEGLAGSEVFGPTRVNFQPVFVTTVSAANPTDVFTTTARGAFP